MRQGATIDDETLRRKAMLPKDDGNEKRKGKCTAL